VNFLRNGANAFELQTACPAVSVMVQTYLALPQEDLEAAHHKTSPVKNRKL